MKMNVLGRTGYEVSAVGLGCYQFTGEFGVNPDVSWEIMDYAMRSEINFIDTAQMYGYGESEEIVGRGLYKYPEKKAIIATKVGYLDRTVSRQREIEAYTDIVEIKRAIKHSLWLLRRDFVEIFMIHEPDNNWWWNIDYETGDSVVLSVLEELKKEGVIGYIGVGGWNMHINAMLVNTGRIDAVLCAGGINLLAKPIFDELIPVAKKHNAGVITGGSFGQNNPLLINKDKENVRQLLNNCDKSNQTEIKNYNKLLALYDLADEINVSMPELAIRYILSFDEIHAHIPGAREVAHLIENLNAANKGVLSEDIMRKINDIQK